MNNAIKLFIFILLITFFSVGCSSLNKENLRPQNTEEIQHLQACIKKLEPIHQKLQKPKFGDWLYDHNEPGQTFHQYIHRNPMVPDKQRNIIYPAIRRIHTQPTQNH